MPFISGLVDSIDTRIIEAKHEIAVLEAAQVALAGVAQLSAPAAATPARTRSKPERSKPERTKPERTKPERSTRGRSKPSRRSKRVEVVPAAKLELILSEAPGGLSSSKLAASAGGDRIQVLALLRELEEAGKVRRTGERRTTLWHAYTDEDRIAERAAELKALSA